MNKELKKLDIEINTLTLEYENQKKLSEQIDRLSKAFCDKSPNDVNEASNEEILTEPSEYDKIMAIINDPYKAPELKIELLGGYGVLFPHEDIVFQKDIVLQLFYVDNILSPNWYYKIISKDSDIIYPKTGLPHLFWIESDGTRDEARFVSIDEWKKGHLFPRNDVVSDPLHDRIVAQEFHDDNIIASEPVTPVGPDHVVDVNKTITASILSDYIPHKEEKVKEATAPEPEDNNIRAPFDGEIVEVCEGCLTIKADHKDMKISFDCDFFKVALHDKVEKGQILGQKA